jgi:PAS domain S-box-containing protein
MAPPERPDEASFLAAFVRHLPLCVCVYDADGRCLAANPALLRWLGRGEEDVLGRTPAELWPADLADREAADLRLVVEGHHLERQEKRPGPTGSSEVRASKYPWLGRSGGMVVVFEELPSPASLGRPETLGRYARGIVHDFNNALTSACGHASAVECALSARGDLEKARQDLAALQAALEYACQLPKLLLAFIRDEPPLRIRLDLNELLGRLPGLLAPRLGAGTRLEHELVPGGAWVDGDPDQLTRALLNLAGNALDAMPHGGRVLLRTEVGCEAPLGPLVRVTIQDSGPGISPEVLPHIFEEGFTTRRGTGSGLGLPIANEVAQRHGGRLRCQSSPGQGARFVLSLPAARGEQRREMVRREEGVWAKAPRVLVLESDPFVLKLTALTLEQGGVRAEPVERLLRGKEDGGRRKDDAQGGPDEPVDLVLACSELCFGASGAALRELLAGWPGAGLLVTTAGMAPDLSDFAPAFRGLLSKPYGSEQLLRAVRAALREGWEERQENGVRRQGVGVRGWRSERTPEETSGIRDGF